MAGPPVAARASSAVVVADYFTSSMISIAAECDGSAVVMSGGETTTFTRPTSAYCTRANGTLVLLSSGEPRVASNGLWVEGPGANYEINSKDFTAWDHQFGATSSANTHAAPDGTTTADTVTGTGATSYVEGSGTTSASGVGQVATVYYRSVTGTQDMSLKLLLNGGGYECTTNVTATTTWQRADCIDTSSVPTDQPYYIRIFPGTGSVVLWGAQQERDVTFPSSFIPTAGTSAARNRDVFSFTPGSSIDTAGCFSAIVTHNAYYPGVNRWAVTSGGSPLTGASSTQLAMHDNANTTTRNVAEQTSRSVTAVSGWSGIVTTLSSGGSQSTGVFDGTMGTGAWTIGSSGSGADIYASIKSIKIGTDATGCQP